MASDDLFEVTTALWRDELVKRVGEASVFEEVMGGTPVRPRNRRELAWAWLGAVLEDWSEWLGGLASDCRARAYVPRSGGLLVKFPEATFGDTVHIPHLGLLHPYDYSDVDKS